MKLEKYMDDPEVAEYLKALLDNEVEMDGETADEISTTYQGMTPAEIADYLKSTIGYEDDDLDNGFEQYSGRKLSIDGDGNGSIDVEAEDTTGDGKLDTVEVKEEKDKDSTKKEGKKKSSILDDDYKSETPEEVEIRKTLGVGGKFKPDTPEEKTMLDSTGTVSDTSDTDDSWNDIIGALTERRF